MITKKIKSEIFIPLVKIIIVVIIPLQIFLFSYGCSNNKENSSEQSIIFENVNIIDAVEGLRANQTVIIKGNKIAIIKNAKKIRNPSNSLIIDGAGKYLIPGLWDAHVHLSYNRDIEDVMFPLFIVNGITSIRDTGGHMDLLKRLVKKSKELNGISPRVFIAGPLIDGVPSVYDGSSRGMPNLAIGAATVEDVIRIVDSLSEEGVNQIKAYEMLSPEVFEALLKRAKEKGLLVTGHVPLSMDVVEASNLGLRGMEHMRNLEMACSANYDSLLIDRKRMISEGADLSGSRLRSMLHSAQRQHSVESMDEQRRDYVLSQLAKNNTWQIPTLTIATSGANRVYARESWRNNFRYLPEPVRSQWTNNTERSSEGSASLSSKKFGSWAYNMVKSISDAGIKIMAGTDSPIAYLTPGFSLHEELRLLVHSGLSPMQALEAATIRPAQFFSLDKKMGRIKKGMLADLLLLDANPLDDITNTQKILGVMKNGNFMDRNYLDGILMDLERGE